MRPIAQIIEQVAESNATVLIRGESGVGKELVARGIHRRSSRREMPFVKVNCAALPDELLESELLGHERARSPEQTPRVSASSRRRISARFSSTRSPS
jgi:transcriptional regulator with GAF, ATPase, and Fis domain